MRIQFKKNIVTAFLYAFVAITAYATNPVSAAGEVQVKVMTRLEYAKDNSHGIRRELIHKFKKDAFKKVMASMPQAKLKLVDQYFDEMTEYDTIDKFITKIRTVGSDCNTATGDNCGTVKDKSLILKGIVTISMAAVDSFLQSNSAAAFMDGETSDFAVMFIARKVSSQKKFEDKITKVQKNQSSSNTEVISGGDGTSSIQGGSTESVDVKQSGGSTEIKDDAFSYEIDMTLTSALGSAVSESLVNGGFEPFLTDDYVEDYDLPYLDELVEGGYFGDDGSLDKRTLNGIKKATKEDGIKFLGVGKVDYRLAEKNPVSGKMSIPAFVTVKVFMAKGKRMRTVASVAPQLVYGDFEAGGDATVGQIKAQNAAVKLAMDTIIAQLQSKGLY